MATKHRNSITGKLNEGIDADDSFNRATNRAEDLARELKVTQIRDDVKHLAPPLVKPRNNRRT